MNFIDKIEAWDQQLMLYLNGMHADWMDPFMEGISNPWVSIPVYLVILYAIYQRGGWKMVGLALVFFGLLVLLCDRISVMAFKEVVQRYRPCHNEVIGPMVHTVGDHCGGLYGFVSSHATNFFGIAMLSGYIIRANRWMFGLLLFWAAAIACSRVYLGVHYPGDIACGALLGITLAIIVYQLFKNLAKRLEK